MIADSIKRIRKLDDGKRILAELKTHPDRAQVIASLAGNRSSAVRSWAGMVSGDVLGEAAVPILQQLAVDGEVSVRNGAIQDLLRLDPEALRPAIPRLRKDLKPNAFVLDQTFAMWTLAKLGDRAALPAVRQLAAPTDKYIGRQRVAQVVAWLLEGNGQTIIDALASHRLGDLWTRDLAKAASILGSPEALAALQRCATQAPDDDCRAVCRRFVDGWHEKPRSAVADWG